jgi:hypothetical protein
MRPWLRHSLQTLAVGATLGLLVLGLGGRLAMAAIQVQASGDSNWSFGGTMTVILLGGVSGLAGAAIALVAEGITARLRAPTWAQYLLLAVALLLVTMRGLRGTAPVGALYFYPLVALYAVLLALSWRFLRVRSQSQRA